MIAGVILAGGQSRRMGGQDKCLIPLGDKTILERVLAGLHEQVNVCVLNSNSEPDLFERFGLPIIQDGAGRGAGPLAGVLAGLEWAKKLVPTCEWIVTVPGDAPFIPRDLVTRLHRAAVDKYEIVCARSGGREHRVCALWKVSIEERLRSALLVDGVRKVGDFLKSEKSTYVDWPVAPYDPFLNINTPADLKQAERLLDEQ